MRKIFIIVIFLLVQNIYAHSQTAFSGGVYWTYEDYKNNKLDKKGNFDNLTAFFGITAVFENEQGIKEKVNVTEAFAFIDEKGILWRPFHKKGAVLRTIIKGNVCLYLDVTEINGNALKEIECTKNGRPLLRTNAFYVSKGINGEPMKGAGNVKDVIADCPEAKAELTTGINVYVAFKAYVVYNKINPMAGDYIYPDCPIIK